MKKATHEVRKRQSDIVAVVQQWLGSMRTVEAFGREDLDESRLGEASHATVDATLKARQIKALLSPVINLAKITNTIAQTSVGLERIQAILDTDVGIPQKPNAKDPGSSAPPAVASRPS